MGLSCEAVRANATLFSLHQCVGETAGASVCMGSRGVYGLSVGGWWRVFTDVKTCKLGM